MPIEKVPVVHRFGIISHNQRLDLQERLLQKAIEQSSSKHIERTKNPHELQESFVHQFNNASSVDEKEKCEVQAQIHLERLKRKSGIIKECQVDSKQLEEAWVDLTILSQCKGNIQEESLDVIIKSLNEANFDKNHMNGLFFLAETVLYWLRTDAINSPYLRLSEIKLLKIAYLVFLRLFYHHMAGDLRGQNLFKSRLNMYLNGLPDYQEAYSPYPNAHFCLRYVIEVGKVITFHNDIDQPEVRNSINPTTVKSHFGHFDASRSCGSVISRSVHDLAPTLWHALDVWRCICVTGKEEDVALSSLSRCGAGMASESWIDVTAALLVLAEAAKHSLNALTVLQSLACGPDPLPASDEMNSNNFRHSYPVLAESNDQELEKGFEMKTNVQSLREELEELQAELSRVDVERVSLVTPKKITRQSLRTVSSRPPTSDANNLRDNQEKPEPPTPVTYRNSPVKDCFGIQGWQWEVAVAYTDRLADLVMFGSTSTIQKVALLGAHQSTAEVIYGNGRPPLHSAGLLDMLHFHVLGESTEQKHDWAWRVRYAAVQGLVQVCNHLQNDSMADGLYNIAWNFLLQTHTYEDDERVLEALKFGLVGTKRKASTTPNSDSKCGSRLADGLCRRYLPPVAIIPPPVKLPPRQKLPKLPAKKPDIKRTTLREEQKLADLTNGAPIPNYRARVDKDLMRIVEDQWRKELQLGLEKERKNDSLTT